MIQIIICDTVQLQCAQYYQTNMHTIVTDINECEPEHNYTKTCPGEHRVCSNTPGSAECICEAQYTFINDTNSCKLIGKWFCYHDTISSNTVYCPLCEWTHSVTNLLLV